MLEVTQPTVACQKCGKHYTLAIQHGAFFMRSKLLPILQQETKGREVIRELVKIRCAHCGSLYDERENKCPNCGAG
jgi:DNA-directed RNA polymerase subunit RPC12/RpoP